MMKLKPAVVVFVFLFIAILIIPTILVLPFAAETEGGKLTDNLQEQKEPEFDWEKKLKEASTIEVSVYREEKDQIDVLPLENYIVGVVAAEMPAEFQEEALKAQALAARTYLVKHLLNDTPSALLKGADIGDTVTYQAYKDKEQLKEKWGADYNKYLEKISKVVYETRGQIIVYDGKPITAQYFSTSNGYTENAEDYWSNPFPYLKSVESPWDLESKEYEAKITMSVEEFTEKLGVKIEGSNIGEVISRTEGHRVEKVRIGNKEFTGREVREKLGLRSTDFVWERKGNEIVITTKGYGHGVGMSQYGANGMAKEGKNYEEILKHYYQGVKIAESKDLLKELVAKK